MKKTIGKIVTIIFILAILCQNFCYADLAIIGPDGRRTWPNKPNTEPQVTENNDITMYVIVGVVVVVIAVVAFLVLKSSANKDKKQEKEDK